jgi:hypothetical protein
MRARAGVGFAAAVLAMVACARDATADNPPKRDAPDYAGRPAPPPTPGEVLLWVPRVVFFPVYFTSEYLIRRPLGFLVTEAERANIPSVLYDFFAFGPEHKAGVLVPHLHRHLAEPPPVWVGMSPVPGGAVLGLQGTLP